MSRGTRDLKRLVSDVRLSTPPSASQFGLDDTAPISGDPDTQAKLAKLQEYSERDKELIASLQQLLEEKDVELDALQRNFETVASASKQEGNHLADRDAEISRLTACINKLEEANMLSASADELIELRAKMDHTIAEHMESEHALKRERRAREDLEEENGALKRRLDEVMASQDEISRAYDQIVLEARDARNANLRLQNELNDATHQLQALTKSTTDSSVSMHESRARLGRLEAENERLSTACTRTELENGRLSEQVERLEEELRQKSQEVAVAQQKSTKLELKIQDIKTKNEALVGSASALKAENSREGQKASGLRAQLQQAEAAEKRALKREAERTRELSNVKREKDDLKLLAEDLRKQVDEGKSLRDSLEASLRSEHENVLSTTTKKYETMLSSKEGQLQSLSNMLKSTEAATAGADKTVNMLNQQIQGLSQLLAQEKEGRALAVASLEEEVASRDKTVAGLKEHLATAQSSTPAERVRKQQRQLMIAVKKLVLAAESVDSSLMCMACGSAFNNPTTCFPCGHTFCEGCSKESTCQECGGNVQHTAVCEALTTITGKHAFQKQTLATLQRSMAS